MGHESHHPVVWGVWCCGVGVCAYRCGCHGAVGVHLWWLIVGLQHIVECFTLALLSCLLKQVPMPGGCYAVRLDEFVIAHSMCLLCTNGILRC